MINQRNLFWVTFVYNRISEVDDFCPLIFTIGVSEDQLCQVCKKFVIFSCLVGKKSCCSLWYRTHIRLYLLWIVNNVVVTHHVCQYGDQKQIYLILPYNVILLLYRRFLAWKGIYLPCCILKTHLTVEDMLADRWDFWMSMHAIPKCRVKM